MFGDFVIKFLAYFSFGQQYFLPLEVVILECLYLLIQKALQSLILNNFGLEILGCHISVKKRARIDGIFFKDFSLAEKGWWAEGAEGFIILDDAIDF